MFFLLPAVSLVPGYNQAMARPQSMGIRETGKCPESPGVLTGRYGALNVFVALNTCVV